MYYIITVCSIRVVCGTYTSEIHGIEGEPGAIIDACIHLATIDDLLMQFDIVIIISTGHKTCTVES